jgi:hypothetical protein
MKKVIVMAAMVLLSCSSAFAGIMYEFASRNDKGRGSLSGSAAIEGDKMRLELREGDEMFFKDGSIMLSTTGGESFYVLDPKKKEYYEINLSQLLSTAGAMLGSMGGMFKMSFENHTVNVTKAGDGGEIEGYSTAKYVSDSSYDLVMEVFGKKNVQNVKTHTESWVTSDLGREYMTFVQQKGFKTGFEQLDKMIEKETAGMQGFPLKQIVRTTTTSKGKSDTQTTTMTVTSIREASVPDEQFEIPAGFNRIEGPTEALQQLMPGQ